MANPKRGAKALKAGPQPERTHSSAKTVTHDTEGPSAGSPPEPRTMVETGEASNAQFVTTADLADLRQQLTEGLTTLKAMLGNLPVPPALQIEGPPPPAGDGIPPPITQAPVIPPKGPTGGKSFISIPSAASTPVPRSRRPPPERVEAPPRHVERDCMSTGNSTLDPAVLQDQPPPPKEKGKKPIGRGDYRIRSPFVQSILDEPLPKGFFAPKMEKFDGTGDPRDHIAEYQGAIGYFGYSDAVLCKVFPSTLKMRAQDWFSSLTPGTISSFDQLAEALDQHFVASRRNRSANSAVMLVRQAENETLRDYIGRFNAALVNARGVSVETIIQALTTNCRHNALVNNINYDPPSNKEELTARIDKYLHHEELDLTRGQNFGFDLGRPRDKLSDTRREKKAGSKEVLPPTYAKPTPEDRRTRYDNFTPLMGPRKQILYQARKEGLLRDTPPRLKGDPLNRTNQGYYEYHRDYGHDTEDCRHLKNDIEDMIRKGYLSRYAAKDPKKRDRSPTRKDAPRGGQGPPNEKTPQPEGVNRAVNVITGGRDIPGRRSYIGNINITSGLPRGYGSLGRNPAESGAQVSFTEEDLRGLTTPCDDSVVITADIGNCRVARILVDTGSSMDILFIDTLEKMGIDRFQICPVTSPMHGITGHPLDILGKITLPTIFGDEEPRRAMIHVEYMVANMTFPYNAIIGRPSMAALGAAVSPRYQCMKFPTPEGDGRCRSDQQKARSCYLASIKGRTKYPPGTEAEGSFPTHPPEEGQKGKKMRLD